MMERTMEVSLMKAWRASALPGMGIGFEKAMADAGLRICLTVIARRMGEMSAHTPGPWVIKPAASTKVYLIDSPKGNAIGEIVYADTRNPADARLVAAAPELLAALEAIVKSLADQDDEGLIEHAQQMIDARAAIAKARGEA